MAIPTFKCVLVGESGVGKDTFMSRFTEAANNQHQPTNGVVSHPVASSTKIYPLTLATQFGKVKVEVWVSSEKDVSSIRDEFYLHANAAILMFSNTDRSSYKNIPHHYLNLVRVCDSIPIVMVGNKSDAPDRTIKPKMITFHRRKNLQYYDVSALSNYNIEKPFLWLMRKLTANPDLQLVDAPAIEAPQVAANTTRIAQYEQEFRSCPPTIPDDDDDC